MFQDIIQRHPGNPILTAADIPGGASSVFNSAFVRHGGRVVALLRVENRAGMQSIRYAASDDGISFRVTEELMLVPRTEPHLTYEEAIYDPRITKIEDTYYVTYASEN
ncbi:MAG: glycoside hydrolase family 130 protein, partial [Planctomycetota bacterium]